ncbi:hypothetical protein, partial [Barnesiella intestinihominis]|uniref:hypothetical protein n=1 Tax=Barnesiella intestinihominis TaxID=487174 RepID=UPI0039710025
ILPCRAPYAEYRTAMSGGLLSISSSVFCTAKYRGGVRKDGGVNKNGSPSGFVLLAAEKNEPIIKLRHHQYSI